MKKIASILYTAVMATWTALAAVSISPTQASFTYKGGGSVISTSGDGVWTASSDANWLTLASTSGNAGKGCVYTVTANNTADIRVGHITIDGNVYTVIQSGREVSLDQTSAIVGSAEVTRTIILTTEANVSWSVKANEPWITVTPTSGTGPMELYYTVAAFNGVGDRAGTITIGSATFAITQSGIDVVLSPTKIEASNAVNIVRFTVEALATQIWTVTPNASWISVVDSGAGFGGSEVTLAVAENPSYEKRTGTVSVGSAIITIIQSGTDDLAFKIMPEVAAASPSGAFGNVAVYATPDATWSAESEDDWIHIAEGSAGAGNGNVKYVVNMNPGLNPRTGYIRFHPPVVVPEIDLYRGMLFWIDGQTNTEGNATRTSDHVLPCEFDGSFAVTFSGEALPKKSDNEMSFAFSFKVGALNCINRLLMIGDKRNWWFNEDNKLCYVWTTDNPTVYDDLKIESADLWYTLVLVWSESGAKVYLGEKGKEISKFVSTKYSAILPMSTASQAMSNFKFGYCAYPAPGYLQSGSVANVRFWTRCLNDDECSKIDLEQNTLYDNKPSGVGDGVKYDYYPLDGNLYSVAETSVAPIRDNSKLSGYISCTNRARLNCGAVESSGAGTMVINKFDDKFDGSCIVNNGVGRYSHSGLYDDGIKWIPYPIKTASGSDVDASYSLWLKVDSLPSSGEVNILKRQLGVYKPRTYSYVGEIMQFSNAQFSVSITQAGKLRIAGTTITTTDFDSGISIGEWHHLVVSGVSEKSVTIYVDGKEKGNVASGQTLGYIPPMDDRIWWRDSNSSYIEGSIVGLPCTMTIGGWSGAVDDVSFFNKALTLQEVKDLYESGLPPSDVYHTINQGVVTPSLSTDSAYMPKSGGSTNVTLTIAKNVSWEVVTSDSWLTVAGDTSGTGSAEITIKVASNPTVIERSGTVTIAGKPVTIVQEGLTCSVDHEEFLFDETGWMGDETIGYITVNAEAAGSWTASTDADWIYFVGEVSGTGGGTVMFLVEGYDTTTASRSAVIRIGDNEVKVTQRGYLLSIEPLVAEVGGNAGAGRIGVSADPNSIWKAISNVPWITIVSGGDGISDGTVIYQISENNTGKTRIGTIDISGVTYTLTQTCTLTLNTTAIGHGTIIGGGNYSQGKIVTLNAVADAGYLFSHWEGDVVGVTNIVDIKMDSVKNVKATFIPESAAQVLAEKKAAQGGFYTRDQIHNLEVGNLVLDVDSTTGKARIGVQLQETSDLSNPDWKAVNVTSGDLDIGSDGTVGIKASATGNAKFFRVVTPNK